MADVLASAHGRVNLVGEHTDYHEGFVMPCAVPQRTIARVTVRGDRHVHATSAQVPEPIDFDIGFEQRQGRWGDYVQGVTFALARAGFAIGGFDLHIESTVPPGSGLSSSAALEVSLLRALRDAWALHFDDVRLAQLGQRAEVDFVGAPVGIMDQMAASLAGEREALFLDTRSLRFERLPLPAALDLVVIDSGIAHHHASGDYSTRRAESEEAARLLGVNCLRDINEDDLRRLIALPDTLAGRARHIVTENARVLKARDALIAQDLHVFGELLNASHESLRDDYEVSIPPIDLLVSIARDCDDVFGARMTGGGFGGSVLIAAHGGTAASVARDITRLYAKRTGRGLDILVPHDMAAPSKQQLPS